MHCYICNIYKYKSIIGQGWAKLESAEQEGKYLAVQDRQIKIGNDDEYTIFRILVKEDDPLAKNR